MYSKLNIGKIIELSGCSYAQVSLIATEILKSYIEYHMSVTKMSLMLYSNVIINLVYKHVITSEGYLKRQG